MDNKTSAINIQVDSDLKKDATLVLTELGLSMSSAITLFLKQVVKRNGIPFEVTNTAPNKKILDVLCSLVVKDGKVLIAKRNKEDHVFGKWEFPGTRKSSMDDKKALTEVFEKNYGLKINVKDYMTHSICEYPGHIVDLKLFDCDYVDGEFNSFIHSEYKWVNIADLLDYDLADADVILSKYLIKKYIEESRNK